MSADQDGSSIIGSRGSSTALLGDDAGEHEADADRLDDRRALAEDHPAEGDGGDGQQGEQQRESAHRDAPQDVLVDAVADGIEPNPDDDQRL